MSRPVSESGSLFSMSANGKVHILAQVKIGPPTGDSPTLAPNGDMLTAVSSGGKLGDGAVIEVSGY